LLRRLVTRVYIPDPSGSIVGDDVLAAIEPQRRTTLCAQRAEDRVTFDIRLQGDGETVFLAV
jgi:protocatechuate 3,4-dioxygenase alpha subunit